MSLVEHARRELALLGNDKDFDDAIIKAVEAFASYGHGGGSASYAIPLLNDLLQFKNIKPLTNHPQEWMQVGQEGLWQSCRNAEAFSEDGGATYYLLSEEEKKGFKTYRLTEVVRKNEEGPSKETEWAEFLPSETTTLSDNERLRALELADSFVTSIVHKYGLTKNRTDSYTSSEVDQHVDATIRVADWLLWKGDE